MFWKIVFLFFCCLLHIVFSQQLAPHQLKQKVDEIAKAHAEGYKAAITAMNARSVIPKQPVAVNNKPQINQRSFIPKPFASKVVQNMPSAPANSFLFPARQIVVNGVEKSGIPRPQYQPQIMRPVAQRPVMKPAGHTVVERSAAPPPLLGKFMDQQMGKAVSQDSEKKSNVPQLMGGATIPDESKAAEMAKLNAAARHRNVYFDSIGGDPYVGASGVLSHQHVNFQRSRRSTDSEGRKNFLRRHRRSRMRYLGQDLNKLGIVRAVPVFDSPAKQDTGLPSFMKVPSAEMGSLSGSYDNSPAARKSSLLQFEMGQRANQVPEMEIRVLKR